MIINIELTSREIPEFWGRCHADSTVKKLIPLIPEGDYQPCGVEIEAYPSDDVQNRDYTCELWIAVEKK